MAFPLLLASLLLLPTGSSGVDPASLRGATEAGAAALHPAGADFFLEVPDLQAALDAGRGSALVRLAHDPAIRPLIEGLLPLEELEPRRALGTLLDARLGTEGSEAVLRAARSLSLSVGLEGEGPASHLSELEVVVEFGEEAACATAFGWIEAAAPGMQPADELVPGADTRTVVVPETGGAPALLARWGARLVLLQGEAVAAGFRERASGSQTGLDADPLYRKGSEAVGAGQGIDVVRYLQRRSVLEPLAGLFVLGGLAPAGAVGDSSSLPLGGEAYLRMQMRGDRFATDVFAVDEGGGLFGKAPLRADWLSKVPDDAMFAFASSIDPAGLVAKLRETLVGFGAEEPVHALEEDVGFTFDQLAGDLGQGFVFYAMPIKGLAIPESYAWLELAAPDAFAEGLGLICAALETHLPGVSASTRDYRVRDAASGERIAIPITSISLPAELATPAPGVSLQPSFTIVDGHLVVCLSSFHLKRELKRLHEGEGAVAAAFPTIPEGARTVARMDWAVFFDGLLSLAKAFAGMADMGGMELPFDPAALPDGAVLARYLRPTTHVSLAIEGGRLVQHESSLGPEALVLPAVTAALASARMEAASVVDPRADAIEARAKRNVQIVDSTLVIYSLENDGRFPSTLEELTAPTESYPRGFLEETELLEDPWGHPLRYERTETEYRLWSVGPNGVDEDGGGDDVVARE